MKVFLLIIIAFFSYLLSYSQNEKLLDSLLVEAYTSNDSSEYYFSKSKLLLRKTADTANYLYFKFYKNYALGVQDSTTYYDNEVIPLLQSLDSLEKLRKVYERMHYQALNAGAYDEALDYIQMALSTAEKLKDTARISLHTTDKSIIYHDFEDYERGVFYGKKAYDILFQSSSKEYKYLIFANNAIAINFDDWGKADSALYYHFQNVDLIKKVEDTLRYTFVFNNIGNTLLKNKRYPEAKEYILRALAMNKLNGRNYNLATNYTNLATIAYQTGNHNEAKEYFRLANSYAKESKSIEKIRDVVEQEALFYKTIGDYTNALEKQEQFYILRDSVFNDLRAAKVAEIETKYETEKKERALAQTRANLAEKQLALAQKNKIIYGTILFALILGVIGSLLYNQQKLKNRQLEKESQLKTALAKIETQNKLQEQRLQISRDLHDNIGAQLTFIISSLDNLKFGFPKMQEQLGNKLKGISVFTTQTIYELRDTIWAMNKEEISWEDLRGRITNFIDNAKIASNGIDFSFTVDPTIPAVDSISSVKGMNVYRVIQEGVNNAIKYANPTAVKVHVSKEVSNYHVSIEDNGKGFDLQSVNLGNGLNNMKKRTRDIDGKITIESTLGGGTTIILKVPLF